jgi:hypothetical protein
MGTFSGLDSVWLWLGVWDTLGVPSPTPYIKEGGMVADCQASATPATVLPLPVPRLWSRELVPHQSHTTFYMCEPSKIPHWGVQGGAQVGSRETCMEVEQPETWYKDSTVPSLTCHKHSVLAHLEVRTVAILLGQMLGSTALPNNLCYSDRMVRRWKPGNSRWEKVRCQVNQLTEDGAIHFISTCVLMSLLYF